MKKVYSTKYVLTQGIEEVEGKELEREMFEYTIKGRYATLLHGEGKEWHRTLDSAKKRAEQIRDKKIKSLEKQINKIKSLSF